MYYIFHYAQEQCHTIKPYIPGIYSWVGPKRYYNIFSENIVNELNYWIEKHPHRIQSPNLSDAIFVKVNGTLINK